MSTSDNPETDGQTERVNRVLEEILRGYVQSYPNWSEFLPMVELAINNSTHASTTHTPIFVNGLRHPRIPTQVGELARAKPFWLMLITRQVTNDAKDVDVEAIDMEEEKDLMVVRKSALKRQNK